MGTVNGAVWSSGETIGGTSEFATLYIRGNQIDYDNWAANGNRNWDWESVLEYFKKSEGNRDENIASDTKYHSTSGPLKVDHFVFVEPITDKLLDALSEMALVEGTLDNGTRCSAARAFLLPA